MRPLLAMRHLTYALLLTTVALSEVSEAQDTCPIQGIATTDVGTGTETFGPNHLVLTWDAATCSLSTRIDFFACCNVFLAQHFLLISASTEVVPRVLEDPFLRGSTLYLVSPRETGTFIRNTGSLPVPPNPELVGRTFLVQAVPVYLFTIPLPGGVKFATSQAVRLTFQ